MAHGLKTSDRKSTLVHVFDNDEDQVFASGVKITRE